MRIARSVLVAAVPAALMLSGCFGNSAEQYLSAAKVELGKKENSAAIVQLKNALQKNPAMGEARFLLGRALLETGDARGAVIELDKARELGYSEDRLSSALARALLMQGQTGRLLTDFGQTKLNSSAEMADLQASLASAYAASGKNTLAMETIVSALMADPTNVRSQLIRVRLLAASSDATQARAALNDVLIKTPKSAEAWQLKGDLLSSDGKPDDAIKAYQEALQLDKNNIPARTGILTLLLDKKDLDAVKTELEGLRAAKAGPGPIQLFTAMLALERNDLKAAHESIQTPLKLAPQDVRVLYLAGAIEFRRGALLQAEKHLNQAMQAAPSLIKTRALLAQVYLRSGDSGKALSALQPLLVENGTSAEAFSIAAEAYFQEGDTKRAEEALIKAAKLKPDDPSSRSALALIQIGKGKVVEGIAQLRAISTTDPSPIADLALVNTFMQKKDWDQAVKAIDALEAKTPSQPGPRNMRGRIELGRGNKEKARQAFEAAIKIDPVYFPAVLSLAQMDMEAKQPDAAAARFQKILSLQPQNVAASMGLIGLRAQAGASKDELATALSKLIEQVPTEVRPRLALVELQMKNKEFKLAAATAKAAVEAQPGSHEALKALAQAESSSGNTGEAANALNTLSALQPKSPEPQMLLAQLYAAQGNTANAIQHLKRALSIKPSYQPAQSALISTEITRGNFPEARRLADGMKLQNGNEPLAYSLLGDIEAVQKRWAGAAENYRTALKLLPNPDIAIKFHRVLLAGSKTQEAKQFEADWLAAHQGQIPFLTYLGDAALLENNFAVARQRYLAVLKLQPDNPLAANNMAWLLNEAKDSGALHYAELANKLVPDQPLFMDTLAQIHADTGQIEKALELQKRVVALAPDTAMFRLHLAQFYASAGQKAQARDELNRLAALGDKFQQQSEVKKLLNSL